jgi:hypothetical protein
VGADAFCIRPHPSAYSLCWTGLIPLLAWVVVVVPVPADEPSARAAKSAIVIHS